MEKIIGNCSKHPGYNFVNCPLCEIAEQAAKNKVVPGFHAVQYANYFNIQPSPFYGDKSILDAEDVGVEQAEMYAELIAKLLTEHCYPSNNEQNPDNKKIIQAIQCEEIKDNQKSYSELEGERDAFAYNANQYNEQISELQSKLKEKEGEIGALKNVRDVQNEVMLQNNQNYQKCVQENSQLQSSLDKANEEIKKYVGIAEALMGAAKKIEKLEALAEAADAAIYAIDGISESNLNEKIRIYNELKLKP